MPSNFAASVCVRPFFSRHFRRRSPACIVRRAIAIVVSVVNDGRAMGDFVAGTLVPVVEGSKGEVPLRVREHFFDVANRRIEELKAQGESETEIGGRWGISQNMVNRIKARTGGLGIKVLYGMRKDLRRSI